MSRYIVIFLIAMLLSPLPAYALGSDDAREWLKGKNVAYTADEFVLHAEQGDTEVVGLFLDAGIDPNAKDKDGRTAMQVAIEKARGKVIKILIENGAGLKPLTSMIGDKDALLQNAKSLGYLTVSGESSFGEEHFMRIENEDISTNMAEALKLIERKGTPGSMMLLSPSTYNEMKVEREGGFSGLGIVISLDENKTLHVVSPIENTPASRAGLKAGDKIIEINGESTEGLILEDAVEKLRGLTGSQVNLAVKRSRSGDDAKEETLAFVLTRDRIKIPSVKRQLMDGGIGYVRVMEFSRDIADDFRQAVGKLKAEGMRRLVLDLRNNPGGSLGVAAEVADEFLEKGRLICSVEFIHDAPSAKLEAKAGVSAGLETPVVVLVNGSTGGASEMVAGALKHWKAGVLLGGKTSGMGLVQSTVPLPDGSAIIVPTGKLLAPNGDPITGVGLTPDIIVKMGHEEAVRFFMMREGPPMSRGESRGDEPNDEQLRRAVEFLKNYDLSGTLRQNISRGRIEKGGGT